MGKNYKIMFKHACEFAKEKHKGQVDKAGVDYYTGHLTTVANSFTDYKLKTIAILHDTLEDTDTTIEELNKKFGYDICHYINILTKDVEMTYFDYIKMICLFRETALVKLADLQNNMDESRLRNITKEDRQRLEKYRFAAEYIKEHVNI